MQGRRAVAVQRVTARDTRGERASLADEAAVRIALNGKPFAELTASPMDLRDLAVGHLVLAGRLRDRADLRGVRVRATRGAFEVAVRARTVARRAPVRRPPRGPTLTAAQVHALMNALRAQGKLYLAGGGVHTSALAEPQRILLVAEDVGKVNTLDRLAGQAFLQGLEPRGLVLLTTGRLTGAMVARGLAMGCPWLVSHSAPTATGLALAKGAGATVAGYVRAQAFVLHAGRQRLARGRTRPPPEA